MEAVAQSVFILPIATSYCPKCKLGKFAWCATKDKKTKDGLKSWCSPCTNASSRAWAENNPFETIWLQAVKRHKQLGLPESTCVTVAALIELLNGFCGCCGNGIMLRAPGGKSAKNAAHLDKIVPELGYIPSNCIWLCAKCNRMKQDHTVESVFKLWEWLVDKTYNLGEQFQYSAHPSNGAVSNVVL